MEGLKSTLVEQGKMLVQFQERIVSSDETLKNETGALKEEIINVKQLFNDTLTKQENERAREVNHNGIMTICMMNDFFKIQDLTNALADQRRGLLLINETLTALEKQVVDTVERKLHNLSTIVENNIQLGIINPLARTCRELINADPSLKSCSSGLCIVDPDGWNTGDPPIRVRCEKSGSNHLFSLVNNFLRKSSFNDVL